MKYETRELIIALTLAVILGLLLTAGFYIITTEPSPPDPCQNVTGCDYFQCQADDVDFLNQKQIYLLEKQNCILEKLNNGIKEK
jgi:hypothetical protein